MLQIGIPSSSPRGTSRGHHSVYLLQESGGSMDQVDRHNILKLQPTHIHPRLRALKGDIMLVAGDTHTQTLDHSTTDRDESVSRE